MNGTWTTVTYGCPKGAVAETIILKPQDGTNVSHHLPAFTAAAVMHSTRLTKAEKQGTYIKTRIVQGLIAADTCKVSAQSKLLNLTEIELEDGKHPIRTYLAIPGAISDSVLKVWSVESPRTPPRLSSEST